MNEEKPVLVNGCCTVLKEHCYKSNFASLYYTTNAGFRKQLYKIDHFSDVRKEMGQKGKKYVAENYNWTLIIGRLRKAIEEIGK